MSKILAVTGMILATALAVTSVEAVSVDHQNTVYRVTKVKATDVLNLRAEPSSTSAVIAALPANGQGILALGDEVQVGRSVWAKVVWAGLQGWVNKTYLEIDDGVNGDTHLSSPVNRSAVLQCRGTEPFWSVKISETLMDVAMADGLKYKVAVDFRQQSVNNTSIAVVAGGRGNAYTTAFLQKVETCSDGMSDTSYPYAMTAVLNSRKVVSGCCSLSEAH